MSDGSYKWLADHVGVSVVLVCFIFGYCTPYSHDYILLVQNSDAITAYEVIWLLAREYITIATTVENNADLYVANQESTSAHGGRFVYVFKIWILMGHGQEQVKIYFYFLFSVA